MDSDADKPVSVVICDTVVEADVLKIALEEQGIEASIDGAALNTTFGLSSSLISAAKIIVRQKDADQAKRIVQATRESYTAPIKTPWFCGKCLEEVEGGFEVCWSCSSVRAEVEAPFPSTAVLIEPAEPNDVDTTDLGRSTDNPWESPRAIGAAEVVEEEVDPDIAKAESMMINSLLFSAACLLVPVIPAAGALWFMFFVFRKRLPLSLTAKVGFWGSVLLLALIHAAWFFFLGL